MSDQFHPNVEEYELIYGKLSDTQDDLIKHLENLYRLDSNKVLQEEERLSSIEWSERDLVFFIVPKGTPRPRTDGNHFYVKGASKLHKIFKKYLSGEGLICTRVEYSLKTYQPTPIKSMTKMEVLMCEKGLIRPLVTPDWDNLAKTYTDCLQGVLLLNDNIINPGSVEKYYSIKPRIEIKLRWQNEFDCKYNERKTRSSIGYKKFMGDQI